MEKITCFKTRDGKIHETMSDAKRHAESAYGNALTQLAHQIINVEKYAKICEYIDVNIEKFAELKALKDDIEVENGEDEQ